MSPRRQVVQKLTAAGHQAVPDLAATGSSVMRYGLVTTLVWIGALKFTDYEVQNAEPLVTASPP